MQNIFVKRLSGLLCAWLFPFAALYAQVDTTTYHQLSGVEVLQWLMWQMGGLGPMFGQLGFFHNFAGKDYEDKRPLGRYVAESRRLLGVLDRHLAGRKWVAGDEYTIADIAIWPWVRNLVGFYGAGDLVEFDQFKEVQRVLAAFVARPAVAKGLNIPART